MRSRGRQRGYTLIEVLVAFVILALSLTVLLRIFATGVRSVAVSADYAQAVLIAETRLASAGVDHPLTPGRHSGTELEKFRWTQTVSEYRPFAPAAPSARGGPAYAGYRVAVRVEWRNGTGSRSVDLATVRLARAEGGR